MRETGTYEIMGSVKSFTPYPLPPKNPPFLMTPAIIHLYGEASYALGQLNEMSARLPDQTRFIRAYVIKEALLTSAIEGIHTTLIDVFTQRLDAKPNKETQLVLNYTKSLETALDMIENQGFPLVNRVILKAHSELFHGSNENHAGNFRNMPVRVGHFIPPSAPNIPKLMQELENYINEENENNLPSLIMAGLVHVQFETIHPFLDGNGRIGRLLIVLMLIQKALLKQPCLYPSFFFKRYQMEYYTRLDSVRVKGDYEGWIEFYLKAIIMSSQDALNRAREIEKLESDLNKILVTDQLFQKINLNARLVLDALFRKPITSIGEMAKDVDKSYNTIHHIFEMFIEKGILVENSGKSRNKNYAFQPYLEILERDF